MSLKNEWTGGQYSLFRITFGAYLFLHFLQLIPWGAELFSHQGVLPEATLSPFTLLFPNILALWDTPIFVSTLLMGAMGLSVLFAVGYYDRFAAGLLWYLWACFFGRNPLIANPSLPYVGWLLLAHILIPPAPYGSWTGRRRIDPAGTWHMPQSLYTAAWIVMALGYSYSGFTKLVSPSWIEGTALVRVLNNPLARPTIIQEALLAMPDSLLHLATWGALGVELLFAPLALIPRLHSWLWGVMLGMHLSLIIVIDFADLSLGMVVLHLFTFNPSWIPPRRSRTAETIFYDGHCGLCHRAVRFVLAEDRTGEAFRFAPLESEIFRSLIPEQTRITLPDSLIIRTNNGILLTRSEAVLYILSCLGGVWRVLGSIGSCIPATARDWAYETIARIRHLLFQSPTQACPLLPTHLRQRFEM